MQIGPRIRVGGTVGKVGQNVKNAVTKGAVDAGHAVGTVASNPVVQGLTMAGLIASGVGAPAAAAIMAAQRGGGALLKPGGNIGAGVTGGLQGAAAGYGASKVAGMIKGRMGGSSGIGVGDGPDGESPPPGAVSKDPATGGWLDSVGNLIKDNLGNIISAGGAVLEGQQAAAQHAASLAEQKREFEANLAQRQAESKQSADQFGRTTGDTEAQAAVRAETQLNKAPVADKAQALLLARMGVAPGQFKPRDYTQGTSRLGQPQAAPGANVATSMQNAAANYKPGQGGVDTSTLKMLLAKMTGSSGLKSPTTPTVTTPTLVKPKLGPTTGSTGGVATNQPIARPSIATQPDPRDPGYLDPTTLLRRRMGGFV